MRIYPQDLGSKWHVALVSALTPRLRGRGVSPGVAGDGRGSKRLGPLGRFWTGGAGIDPEASADGLAGMQGRTTPLRIAMSISAASLLAGAVALAASGQPGGAVVAGGGAALYGSIGLLVPRFLFRYVHGRPVAAREVETLLPTARDDLDRSYLTLVIDAIRQPVPPETGKELRIALRTLGEAIDRLPVASGPPLDGDALRQEATQTLAKAQAEPDALIAASQERRAEALRRRADANDRSDLLVRRSAALREELAAQTEALRAGLLAFNTGGADGAGLAHLAEAVRGVAAEAVSVAAAREELDAALSTPIAKQAATDAPIQVLQNKG